MKIEKLNENKIRITLDLNDLEEKNIDFHSFMSNSIDAQSLFMDMLEKAEEEIGFKTKDYKIMIEALATSDGNFIITVTRLVPDLEKNALKKKKLKIKRKSPSFNNQLAIYKFKTFDDFCDFCVSLDHPNLSAVQKSFSNTSLYSYNSYYYLIIAGIKTEPSLLKSFCTNVTEFGSYVHNSKLFYNKLTEYGKIIIKKNAIKICMKHFK